MYSSPPSPAEGNENSEGDPEGGNFQGVGGLLREVFFFRGLSEIGELLINNSFSVG